MAREEESPEKDAKKVKAANARAKSLSKAERSEIARKAAKSRWSAEIPVSQYEGEIPFGNEKIPCAVLPDGRRVLSERGVTKGFGLKRAGSNWQRKTDEETGARMPVFASANNLIPFMDGELRLALSKPILYRPMNNRGAVAFGTPAEAIPKICEVWLRARDAGVLNEHQKKIAVQAELIIRGLAHVGIIALVDEATGFQNDRARNALAEILEAFIKSELGKWAKRFPDDYYKELFRLKGLKWPFDKNPPQYVGHWTNNLVYSRLAPGVLDELRKKTPKLESGNRKNRFHQWLTEDVGNPRLQEHFVKIITLMQSCDEWDDFEKRLNRVAPKFKAMPLFDSIKDADGNVPTIGDDQS